MCLYPLRFNEPRLNTHSFTLILYSFSIPPMLFFFFFFNDPAPPEISPLPLPAALPISPRPPPPYAAFSAPASSFLLELQTIPAPPLTPGLSDAEQISCLRFRLFRSAARRRAVSVESEPDSKAVRGGRPLPSGVHASGQERLVSHRRRAVGPPDRRAGVFGAA